MNDRYSSAVKLLRAIQNLLSDASHFTQSQAIVMHKQCEKNLNECDLKLRTMKDSFSGRHISVRKEQDEVKM